MPGAELVAIHGQASGRLSPKVGHMETPSSLRPSQGPQRAPSCPSLREQQGEITGFKEGVHTNP